ncbi:MAG: HAD hydrolase-like protein [Myxococcota bacterium]|nr:HAD hydrolase-like protein [Myxococcota bacterium]
MTSIINAVFFDVDGVLIDSLPAHLQICRDKNRQYNLGLNIPTLKEFKEQVRNGIRISPMKYFFIAVGFPESLAELAVIDYERHFVDSYKPPLFPGIKLLLHDLSERGVALGIVTSNTLSNITCTLKDAMHYFDRRAVFANDHPPGLSKHEALLRGIEAIGGDAYNALLIGDQPADLKAAQLAGVRFLAVTYGWGFSQKDNLTDRVSCPQDIADYVLAQRPAIQ